MKKNIAFFIRSLHKGGAEKQSILLASALKDDFNVYLYVWYAEGEFLQLAQNLGINLILLKGNILVKFYKFYSHLKMNNIECLFNFLPMNNIVGITIGKAAGVKGLYGGIRGVKKKKYFKMQAQKFLCNKIATRFISNSHAAKKSYERNGFNKEKIIVIPNLVEIEGGKYKKREDICNILSVGRFVPEKDYVTSIRSFNYLLKKFPIYRTKINYNIFGYGSLKKELCKIVNEWELSDIIKIQDGTKEIFEEYAKADIFLCTSIYEGMSNSIMEAMSYSLPVVATNVGDNNYLIKDGFNGYLCEKGNFILIAERIKALIDNYELRVKLGKNNGIILQEFAPSVIANKYKLLINKNNFEKKDRDYRS